MSNSDDTSDDEHSNQDTNKHIQVEEVPILHD